MAETPRLEVLGIVRRHAWGMLGCMAAQGCTCAGWWTAEAPPHEAMFA